MKVLVVDDNAINRKYLRTLLTTEGYNVLEAEDGQAALEILEREKIDAVISDILMPRKDGYRLCHDIRRDQKLKDIPFIAYTATYVSPADEKVALDFGADRFLTKPVPPQVIIEALHEAMQNTHTGSRKEPHGDQQLVAMREYSEALIRKLEEKNVELGEANEALKERAVLAKFDAERIRAILESALDCIITMDHEGKIIEFNPAAEKTFNYPRAEVIGKDLGELIIPSSLRERHRRGLAHYLTTGEAPVLGKRLEITAIRADATEFPVELSIIRVPGSEPPIFTGFIRDITERKRAEESLQARYHELQTLHELSQAILNTLDLQTVLNEILDQAMSVDSFDLGTILLVDPSGKKIEAAAARGYQDPANLERQPTEQVQGRARYRALSYEKTYLVENVAEADGLRTLKKEGIQSAVLVPVRAAGKTLGFIQVGSRTQRKFNPDKIRLLEAIGNQMGVAIQKARLHEETQRNLERIQALHEIDKAISSTLDLNATLVVLQRIIPKFVPPITASTVRLMDKESGRLDAASCWNLSENEWRAHVKAGQMTLADKVFESQKPLKILNVERDSAHPADFARKYGLTSYLGVPLSAKEEQLGVLGLYTKEEHEFTNQEIEFLNTLAGQAAIAIHNARLYEETKRRRREAEELARVAQSLTATLDMTVVGQRVVTSVRELFGAKGSTLRLLQPDGSLRTVAFHGEVFAGGPGTDTLPGGMGVTSRAFAEGKPVWSADMLNDPKIPLTEGMRDYQRQSGNSSLIAVPLRVQEKIIGALTLADRTGRFCSDNEIALAQTFADQAALAL